MREISLNGYIDEEVWFGDEITPDSLHETLYEPGADLSEDVHIRLNSYGGSCNAAVRMHDDLVAYPGDVTISISGTAASAATVLAMAADVLEMSPGSLFMIHDPSTLAFGNEADLMDAINMLRACKESIINVYQKRTHAGRDQIAKMMRDTTWMDAEAALAYGFIDRVTESNPGCTIINSAAARDVAEKRYSSGEIDISRCLPPRREWPIIARRTSPMTNRQLQSGRARRRRESPRRESRLPRKRIPLTPPTRQSILAKLKRRKAARLMSLRRIRSTPNHRIPASPSASCTNGWL